MKNDGREDFLSAIFLRHYISKLMVWPPVTE